MFMTLAPTPSESTFRVIPSGYGGENYRYPVPVRNLAAQLGHEVVENCARALLCTAGGEPLRLRRSEELPLRNAYAPNQTIALHAIEVLGSRYRGGFMCFVETDNPVRWASPEVLARNVAAHHQKLLAQKMEQHPSLVTCIDSARRIDQQSLAAVAQAVFAAAPSAEHIDSRLNALAQLSNAALEQVTGGLLPAISVQRVTIHQIAAQTQPQTLAPTSKTHYS